MGGASGTTGGRRGTLSGHQLCTAITASLILIKCPSPLSTLPLPPSLPPCTLSSPPLPPTPTTLGKSEREIHHSEQVADGSEHRSKLTNLLRHPLSLGKGRGGRRVEQSTHSHVASCTGVDEALRPASLLLPGNHGSPAWCWGGPVGKQGISLKHPS